MNKSTILKVLALAAVLAGLMIPLAGIESTIAERALRRHQAVSSVQQSFAGPQTLITPVWVWPYREEWETRIAVGDNKRYEIVKHSADRHWVAFFDSTHVAAEVGVRNDHYRGIHRVRTYDGKLRIESKGRLPDRARIKPENEGGRLIWDRPALVIGLTDLRGLRGTPKFALDGAPLEVQPGTRSALPGTGLHAYAMTPDSAATLTIDLPLAGMEQMSIVPTAASTTTELRTDWPHAKYSGAFLPTEKDAGAQGSGAKWAVPSLASGVQSALQTQSTQDRRANAKSIADAAVHGLNAYVVEFVDPVNVYRLAERATKYGVLFITLVLAAVFLLDVIQRLGIHAMQYGLVGLALAIFFLLLLALSEHVAFGAAYMAAAAACTALIAMYMRHALKSAARGAVFAVALAAVYAAIYAILIAEQMALLMGALLLFGALATVMITTRRTDWSRLAVSGANRTGS